VKYTVKLLNKTINKRYRSPNIYYISKIKHKFGVNQYDFIYHKTSRYDFSDIFQL